MAGIAPKKYLDRHTIKIKNIATLDLNLEEKVQVFGLSIAVCCGLFLLGNYGVEGDFNNDEEKWYFRAAMVTGMAVLLVTATFEGLAIRGEINRDHSAAGAEESGGQEVTLTVASTRLTEEDDAPVTELSSVWVGAGVIATMALTTTSLMILITGERFLFPIHLAMVPFVFVLYTISLLAQPRNQVRSHILFQSIHFVIFAWGNLIIIAIFVTVYHEVIQELVGYEVDFAMGTLACLLALPILTIWFYFLLRIRANIGRLPDMDLNEFLVEKLIKGGFTTLASMVFLLFRSTKCFIETGVSQCTTNALCSTFTSLSLLFWWGSKLVETSIKERKDLAVRIEKIAQMKISWRNSAEGIMLAVMAGCGASLFALMSAEKPEGKFVLSVGSTGLVAGAACVVLQVVAVVKEQSKRGMQSQLTQPAPVLKDDIVDSCSWWFVAASFLVTTSYTALAVIYACTLEDWTWQVGNMIIAIVGTCMVIAVVLRPKDEGAGIKVLHLQFAVFAIGSELAYAVGDFRHGDNFGAVLNLIRIVIFWLPVYVLSLKLRRRVAQLPPALISKYICNSVLCGGVKAMSPMIFFSFETLSCVAGNGLESDQCKNTSMAALFLSIYLATITAVSLASKAVSREQRGEGLTYESLAILMLKKREMIQGALGVITTLVSMYLFSVLGVQGDPNVANGVIGAVGGVTLGIAALIEVFTLTFGDSQGGEQSAGISMASRRDLSGAGDFASEKRFSIAKGGDDITIMGMV